MLSKKNVSTVVEIKMTGPKTDKLSCVGKLSGPGLSSGSEQLWAGLAVECTWCATLQD